MGGNQQVKLFAKKNHPRVLQQYVVTLHWVCNADFQCVLANNMIYGQIFSFSVPYRTFVKLFLKWVPLGLISSVLLKISLYASLATTPKETNHLPTGPKFSSPLQMIGVQVPTRPFDLFHTSYWLI
jgi:hypothetical protein